MTMSRAEPTAEEVDWMINTICSGLDKCPLFASEKRELVVACSLHKPKLSWRIEKSPQTCLVALARLVCLDLRN